jgi:hypothetical protein
MGLSPTDPGIPQLQCNQMVFVMGFPFKLLEDASLRTVFFILFPLSRSCYSPGFEFLRAYTKRAELVFAYMGIRGNDTHITYYDVLLPLTSHNPPPLCPLSSAPVVRSAAVPNESNTGARRAPGFARAAADFLVWGTETAPIEK